MRRVRPLVRDGVQQKLGFSSTKIRCACNILLNFCILFSREWVVSSRFLLVSSSTSSDLRLEVTPGSQHAGEIRLLFVIADPIVDDLLCQPDRQSTEGKALNPGKS